MAAHQRLSFLSEASRALSGSLEIKSVLASLAKLAVPRIADWCLIDLADENGALELVGAADVEPGKVSALREMRRRFPPDPESHPVHRVLREGRALLEPNADERWLRAQAHSPEHLRLLRKLGPGSLICAPLKAGGRTIGVLSFGRGRGRTVTAADLQLGKELGRRAGEAIENARLYDKARRTEELLSRALSANRMVAWSGEAGGGLITRSANTSEIYGADPGPTLATALRLIHQDDRAGYEAVLTRAIREHSSFEARFRMVRADGSVVWMEEHGSAQASPDGRVRVWGVVLDVTERKRADDQLERQRLEQQLILDSVPAMIWFKDDQNRILRVNRAAAQWCGRPVTQLEGRCASEIFPGKGEGYHADDLAVIRSGRPSLGVIERCASLSGKKSWVRRDLIPWRDAQGRTLGVIIFAVDVTEIKRAEEVLRESEQAQRDFVANVSHEFRTPVAAIKGFAETLRRGGLEDKANRLSFVRTIESHADRLDWLVQDLLDLARLSSGMVKLKSDRIDLKDYFERYLEGLDPVARRRGARVEVDVDAALAALGDAPHLVQVLDNLVGNALKYSPRGGVVRLEARVYRGRVRVSVCDQGIGIEARHLPRLFDRFYRVAKGDSGGSTGLGLHIVKTIVEAQKGRVWAESTPGRGSAFHFTLPRAPRAAAARP